MDSYLSLVRETLEQGHTEHTRTGLNALSVFGKTIEHDLSNNTFPLLTTKFVSLRLIASELEFFIKGITDKRWLQERNNHIWDDWANPKIINSKYSFATPDLESTLNTAYKDYLSERDIIDTPRLQNLFSSLQPFFILENSTWKANIKIPESNLLAVTNSIRKITHYIERDLGPIYGFQWRHFGADYTTYKDNYNTKGFDQLKFVLETLEKEPTSRRMVISAWNPVDKIEMALEPCHYTIQVNVSNNKLNLLWSQRSVDLMLGLPFNIASYALFLKLLSQEANLREGKIIGMLGNVHIYENQKKGAEEQIKRIPKSLPSVNIPNFFNIYNWKGEQFELENYDHYPSIQFPIAV